jgi:Tol biopolymer transport system component
VPFEENGAYQLTVTRDIRDVDGDSLQPAVTVDFTAVSGVDNLPPGRIAFADWNTISVINTDGSGLTTVIDDDGQGWTYMSPAWSPDGRQIAFGSSRDGGWDIYVVNVDGSGLRRLTSHSARDDSPAWSPDGTRIAFTSDRDGDFEIHVMNADGSGIRRVTDHPAEDGDPSWSPDGSMIAFTSNREGRHEIHVINVDGTGTRRVTDFVDPAMVIQPNWSLAGDVIVFTVTETAFGVWTVNADGSQPRRLTNGGGGPTWSPDGTRIVYAGGNLQVINADGSGQRDLGVFGYEPAWGPAPP